MIYAISIFTIQLNFYSSQSSPFLDFFDLYYPIYNFFLPFLAIIYMMFWFVLGLCNDLN